MKQGTDFGIVPGLADNTGPLLAALAWTNARGEKVELPPGEMRTSAGLVLTAAGGGFVGQGSHELPTGIQNGSTIVHMGTSGDTLTFSAAAHAHLEGVLFAPLYRKTSGSEIRMANRSTRCEVTRCAAIDAYRALHIEDCVWTTVEHMRSIAAFGPSHFYISGRPGGGSQNEDTRLVHCIAGQSFDNGLGSTAEPDWASFRGAWQPNTHYERGQFAYANGYVFEYILAGTSGATPPNVYLGTYAANWRNMDLGDGTAKCQARFNLYLAGCQVDSGAYYTYFDGCHLLDGANGITMTNGLGTVPPKYLFTGGMTVCDHNFADAISLSAGDTVSIDQTVCSASATGVGVRVIAGHGGDVTLGYGYRGIENWLGPYAVAPGVPNVSIA